jgi:small-conductance mechanosensitive channel/CRP-like cAMP-binding protein
MGFWQNIEKTSGMDGVFHWLVLAFFSIATLLFYFLPNERARVRSGVFLFMLSLVGLLAASLMLQLGARPDHPSYIWMRCASSLMTGIAIINVASVFLFAVALRKARLEPPRIAQDLLIAFAYIAVAIALLRGVAQVDVGGIVATSAILTAVIGFSLQETLGNIMGGMALQMERTIRVGDWIRVDDVEGKVKEIRWRQTSVETRNWDTVVIPNSVLMKGKVMLLGRRAGSPVQHRQWVYFRVDQNHPPMQVIQAVEAALQAEPIPGVAREPMPHCLVTDFKDGDATYAVRYWLTDLAQTDPTDSVVRMRLYGALQRAGIPLSIPSHAVLLTENDSHNERKQSEELATRLKVLRGVELFQPFTDDELKELAAGLQKFPFVQGETLTRQGAIAHRLYIIVDGEVEVQVTVDGKTKTVTSLGGGDYFGEMGLLTGEPRTATVIAKTVVNCYCMGKEAFEEILRHRPEIADQLAHTLARRRGELDLIREQTGEEASRERTQPADSALLRRIRNFFSLGGME